MSIYHTIIYYLSFSVIPFAFFLLFLFKKYYKKSSRKYKIFLIFLALLSVIYSYARFIEPNMIITRQTSIETWYKSKIVVISDMHIWVFYKPNFLKKLVKKINETPWIDYVLIAWDFSYYPKWDLVKLFAPLKNLKYKSFWVLGNHDSEKPGPPIAKELQKALEQNNVVFLNNDYVKYNWTYILWLWDNWAGKDDVTLINNFKKEDKLVVIAHNPDSVLDYENDIADLTVSGHTHGWQIRIPFIYKKVIPSRFIRTWVWYPFDRWFYNVEGKKVFISSGLWEVWLPLRFLNPPVIDVIYTY